jgi:2-polyprenyl-3-methyl-5-hydroxy-6-metoxy-1,4-benzoquinol methylase
MIRPSLLALVGGVEGLVVRDPAFGQGYVARELARRGARVTGLDLEDPRNATLQALARGEKPPAEE